MSRIPEGVSEITVNVPNQFWVDERIEDADINGQIGSSLTPGEEVEVCKIESTDPNIKVRPRAVGASLHAGDVFNDGTRQSIVRYRYERKYRINDEWSPMGGLSSTLRYGRLDDPTEIVPGEFLEPLQGFRIIMVNRTDTTANQFSVGSNQIGALVSGIVTVDKGGER